MMMVLEEQWEKLGVQFNAANQHNRCIAHIINLGVQDALKTLNVLPTAEDEDEPALFLRLGGIGDTVQKVNFVFIQLKL